MAIIKDYIDWRGDVTMEYAPFNEVDNYIVSKIGGPDFSGIVPSDEEEISIAQAVVGYRQKKGEAGNYLGALASPQIVPVVFSLPETARFKDLRLTGYVKKNSEEELEQFAALTVKLPDGRYYISFRGTDDTILAWKEDFMMCVEDTVAAQRDALEYLEWAAAHYEGQLIVGGHSKGGNLAVYAAVYASEEIQSRITDVYNNDGPGFKQEFYETEGYTRIKDRIHTILPRHSLVGTLFNQDENAVIVNDSCRGAGAHDGFTWETSKDRFVRSPKGLSRSSMSFDESMNKMLEKMDIEERKAVINEVFAMIETTGSSTITDIAERRWHQAKTVAKSLKNAPETKKFVTTIAEMIFKDYVGRLTK